MDRDLGVPQQVSRLLIASLCAIMRCMSQLNLAAPELDRAAKSLFSPLRALGLATALIGAASLGLYIGRELRFRYKFRRRTPSDFFSNAGDPIANAEYGMGV